MTCQKRKLQFNEYKTCQGALIYTHKSVGLGNYSFTCTQWPGDDNETDNKHNECACTKVFPATVNACTNNIPAPNSFACSDDDDLNCSITWRGTIANASNYQAGQCVSNRCTATCEQSSSSNSNYWLCNNYLNCSNACNMARTTTTTTTIPPNRSATGTPPQNEQQIDPGSQTNVIALSVGTGVLVVVLIVAIVALVFMYRRYWKRLDVKSKRNAQVKLRESQSYQLDGSAINVQGKADDVRNGPNKMNGNEYSSPINQTPGNYMDLEGTGDDIYHTIDEYGFTRDSRYAEVSDVPPPSNTVDIKSDDAPPTGEHFVLTKEDDHSSSPTDEDYDVLHNKTSDDTTDDYSHARVMITTPNNASSHGQTPLDDDYDRLTRTHHSDTVTDYDRLNNVDSVTSET